MHYVVITLIVTSTSPKDIRTECLSSKLFVSNTIKNYTIKILFRGTAKALLYKQLCKNLYTKKANS